MTVYLTGTLGLMALIAVLLTYQTRRPSFGRYSPTHLAVAAANHLHRTFQLRPRRDENGLSDVTTQLGMVALGIVLLVGLFALLNTFGGKVISYIQNQLGIS